LSRLALAAWLALLPAAGASQTVTADQAIGNYRKVIKTTRELDCPQGTGDEIVVCGGQDESEANRQRLPLPVAPEPGAPIRLVPGEPPRATLTADACQAFERCRSGFSISVDIIGLPSKIGKIIDRLNDDD